MCSHILNIDSSIIPFEEQFDVKPIEYCSCGNPKLPHHSMCEDCEWEDIEGYTREDYENDSKLTALENESPE